MHSHYTLGLIPGEVTVFQQCCSNLGTFDIISYAYKLKICVELVGLNDNVKQAQIVVIILKDSAFTWY